MTIAHLRRTLATLSNIPEPALRAACKAVEQIALQEGGSITMRRSSSDSRSVSARVYKLKAISRIKAEGNTVTATVHGVPTGFWVWKNTGTDAHEITAKRKTKRGKKHRPRTIHGAGYAQPVRRVDHPGSTGRGAWRRTVKRSRPVVAEIVRNHVHRAVTSGS